MIPVAARAEPAGFDAAVRQPGARFLAENPKPSAKLFQKNNFWSRAIADLYAAYGGTCAYIGIYLPRHGTVDHFSPKSLFPQLAYEWRNFRLANPRANLHKGTRTDVLDPFAVCPGWFQLDFPSCLVRPGDGLPDEVAAKIANTIRVLKLNEDDTFVQERCDMMVNYADGHVGLAFLIKRYPFLAAEIERQGIQETVAEIFKRRRTES